MLLTFYLLPLLAGLLESASSPTFVNNPIDPSLTASSVNVQNHWSEAITLPRPDLSKTDFNNSQRLNCPYSAQGLKRWSDPSIWPNSAVPIADTGTAISLPVGVSVLVAAGDLSSSVYGYITIPVGSKLIFADADITLSTLGMIVQGSLAIGAETCPLSSKVKIILYGSKPNSLPVSPSVKGIHVTGRLDIHGVIYAPTWTRLARTAEAGDTLIYLQDLVNWEPGQTVMITTTEYKDSLDFNHNDVATIDTVYSAPHLGPKVSVIKLTSALKYRHYADTEYQAEVAMLSRRIVIMGDDSSEDSTSTAAGCLDDNSKSTHPCGFISGYGGHVMIDTTGIGRVTGVEFYHMGQTNVMARYPFHFHMLGVYGNTSAIRYSSIRESFYRAVAVHGSNSTLVSNNVAFNITGNAYYIEDGVEEDSLFEFNLGAFVHVLQFTNQASFWLQQMDFVVASPTLLVPTDLTASPFYITNPANKFIGNAASGGWSGFAFPGLPKPIQLHRNVLMNPPPFSRMLPQFEGNSAHSTGHWWNNGGGIYVGGLFEHDPNDPNGVLHYNPGRISTIIRDPCNGLIGPYGCTNPAWLRFNNTKVFLANRGIMGWGPRIEVVKYEGHDCGKSANALGQVWVDKMLAICRTRNVPQFLNGCQSPFWYQCSARDVYNWQGFVGFEWYDVGQMHILTNITFRNCDGHMGNCIGGDCNSAPWSFVTHSDTFIPENMQATRGVVYQNCDPTRLYKFGARPVPYSVSGRLQNWRDIDGSASMRYVPTQMGSTWALDWWKLGNDSCVRGPKEMDMWECDYPTTTASMLFQTDFAQFAQVGNTLCGNGNQISCPTLGYINHIYRSDLLSGLIMTPNPKVTGMADDTLGGGWYIRWYAGAPKSLTITNIQLMKANGLPGATLLVAIPYPPGTTFTVTGKAADWCYAWQGNLCTHPYQPMSSLAALRALTSADGYFWDSNINVLYVSVVQQKYDGLGPGVWDPFRAPDMFVRDGITLVGISGFRIVIEASCTVSQSNAAFCALDNSDFNVVRTAIGAPVFMRSRSSAPLSSSLAPSISAAPSTAIPSSSPPSSKAPSTVVPSSSPIPTNAPSTALPSSSPIPSKAPSTAVPSSSPMPTKAPSTRIPSSSPIPSVSRAPSTVAPSSIPVSTASTSASSAPISSSPPSSLAPSSLSNSKASSSAQPVLSVSSASTQTPSAQPTAPTKASSASSPSPSAIIQTAISTATWASTAHTAVYRFSFTTAPKSSPTSTRSSQLSKKALLLSNSTESLPWPTSSLPVPGPSSSGSYSSGQASVQDSSSSWVNTLSSSNIGISAVVVVAAAIAAGVYMMFRRRQQRKLKAQPLQLRVSAQL